MERIIDAILIGMDGYDVSHLYRHCFVCFFLALVIAGFCMVDFISGTYTAKKLGEPLRSHRYRKTVEKIAWYWLFLILGFMFGLMGTVFSWYDWPYISMAITAAIGIIEGKSMLEHARRRKCRTAKIPETIHDIIEFVGDDNVRRFFEEMAHRRVPSGTETDVCDPS